MPSLYVMIKNYFKILDNAIKEGKLIAFIYNSIINIIK